MKRLSDLGGPTPWEHVGLSRQEYHLRAPWRRLGMRRATFERLVLSRPAADFVELRRSADAERLIAAALGG